MRYFVRIAYDGSNYHGWQSQHNGSTIQDKIQYCLSKLLKEEIMIVGCGRTDTGVHASSYVFHFDVSYALPENFLFRMNRFLPNDIVFYSFWEVSPNSHARYDATERAYRYVISTIKPIYNRDYCWYLHQDMDDSTVAQLNDLSRSIIVYDDFQSFCKSNSGVQNFRCTISKMEWIRTSTHELIFEVRANRFLRGMIRLLVGSHINLIQGKVSKEAVLKALANKLTQPNALSAPAHGLFLMDVKYPTPISEPTASYHSLK